MHIMTEKGTDMKLEDLEIGKYYTRDDDALYKVVAKGIDWVCVLHYSLNHRVCNAEICNEEKLYMEGMHEDIDDWNDEIFDELVYGPYWQNLVPKED